MLDLVEAGMRNGGEFTPAVYSVENELVNLSFYTWIEPEKLLVKALSIYGEHNIVVSIAHELQPTRT